MLSLSNSLQSELALRHKKHGHLQGRVGLALYLYYAQDMPELAEVFRAAFDTYIAYIPPNTLNFYNNHEDWRPFKPRSLNRLFNRFASEEERGYWLDFAQIAFEEGEDGPYAIDEIGNYGITLAGQNKSRAGPFKETCVCAIQCEFPQDELLRSGVEGFLAFVERLAALAPFDSGHAGFSFIYSPHTSEQAEHAWVSFKAPRFLAVHPYTTNYENSIRHHIANVNWLTLLGTDLTQKLGGAEGTRTKLSDAVNIKSLNHGTMLIAGDSPPLGDMHQQANDLAPLREVAQLTRPLWVKDEVLRNDILNSFWHGSDDSDRWINRFEQE